MTQLADRSRYEYKFKIPLDLINDVRKFIKPYMKFDPYLEKHGNRRYTVRSIYFDTPELDFYYEKIDGVKIRKKLRVRTYNQVSDFAFLEIKRKYINCIAKERSQMPFVDIEKLIDAPDQSAFEYSGDDRNGRLVSGKFLYNLLKKGLEATLLVVYDREAYVSQSNPDTRVTFDMNLRVQYRPNLRDLVDDKQFVIVTKNYVIMEFKFDDFMPQWMKTLIKDFGIRKESISKYCLGIEACRNKNYIEEE